MKYLTGVVIGGRNSQLYVGVTCAY